MAGTFNVALPASLTGFLPDLELNSGSFGWSQVIEGEHGPRRGHAIRVPDFLFDATRRVHDETAYRLSGDNTLVCENGPPEKGCIAVVLESPHRDEFDGRGGTALGPLRSPAVRRQVEKHLPRLTAALEERLGESLAGRSIVLVNAVQYQASLQAIMRDYDGKLQSGVRTSVWKRIFHAGGAAEFEARLDGYDPRVVLVATTGVVRRDVLSCLAGAGRRWPWIEVDYHPSYWGRRAPNLCGQLR